VSAVDRPAGIALFRPLIPASVRLRELSVVPLIVGVLLGVIFGASSLYLVLKVGLTVSASIPVAVISLTLFRLLGRIGLRSATILEHNIVQTAGSAGESIAFGVGVTMPAIMILGFDLEIGRVMLVAILGGLLGILMMIPLRRALIVQEHGVLKYPEGTACAEVLKAGATPEERALGQLPGETTGELEGARSGAAAIFTGFGVGLVYKLGMEAFRLWKDIPEKVFGAPLAAGSISAEISPELLGVGYIIGPRISATMAAGGVLAYLVLIPAIHFFGSAAALPIPPGTTPIAQMGPDDIRGAYVLYIGAGAVATGGIISLVRSLPMIWRGAAGGLTAWRTRRAETTPRAETPRTDQDLSPRFVALGLLGLVAAILIFHSLRMNIVGAVMIVVFGFLFVTVSSRLTGQIGSSSNPISGMTVATLLLTCLIFLALGWTGPTYYVTALSVGGIVCVAAANGGTTSQDLKTGFLIGSTPRAQQIAILCGALASALALGPILLALNDASTVYVPVVAAAAPLPAGGKDAVLVAPTWRVPAAALAALPSEKIRGPQAPSDTAAYRVWQKIDTAGGPPGRYLVDGTGAPRYLVDPGVNGTHRVRPDGTTVTKFAAPKATLMSYIIKGILSQKLPWALVLMGAMIAVVLEMCGIQSLAFAVGVYLPLSSSAPILIGGLVRLFVDRSLKSRLAHRKLSEAELIAETDKSPGVLVASGYIAGGAIAGIGIAFMAGALTGFNQAVGDFMTAHNPFYNGPWADALALIPFVVLVAGLYLTGRMARTSPG